MTLKERMLHIQAVCNAAKETHPEDMYKAYQFASKILDSKKEPPKKYKLMLKQHWDTGYSYLCVTKTDKYKEYLGSGVSWNRMLKEENTDIITDVIFSTDDVDVLNMVAEQYSILFNLPNNQNFKNMIPEKGYRMPDPDAVFKARARAGGNTTKSKKKGIFDPDLQHMRTIWARENGAKTTNENRGGWYKQKPWLYDRENYIKRCSIVGKLGGKVTGSLPWWTNGKDNRRCNESPGPDWRRGMTKKTKPIPPHMKRKNNG